MCDSQVNPKWNDDASLTKYLQPDQAVANTVMVKECGRVSTVADFTYEQQFFDKFESARYLVTFLFYVALSSLLRRQRGTVHHLTLY